MEGLVLYLFNVIPPAILCLVFILIGRQFNKQQRLTFNEVFFSVFIGVLALSTVVAILKTGGKTVMLGYLLLAGFSVLELRNRPPISKQLPEYSVGFLLAGLLFGGLFVFSWSFFSLIQLDEFPYHIPAGTAMAPNDYLINVCRSYYLGVSGEENYYHFYNTVDPAYHGPKPYHYLEMWTTVGLTNIFGGLTAEKFVLMASPLYHFMAFTGILALWERYLPVKWYHLVLSASFLFVAGIHLSIYNQFGVLDFSLPIFTHRVKMCVYYPFILACLSLFHQDRPQLSVIALAGLLLATVVVAPAVFGGVLLFLGYRFLTASNKRIVLETAGVLLAVVFFVFLFYKLLETGQFNIRANAGSNSLSTGLLDKILSRPFHKVQFVVLNLVKQVATYLPLLLLGLFLVWRDKRIFTRNRSLFVLVAGILLSGAGAYALFEGEKDATQLFFNMGNALLNCCLIWAIVRCLSLKQTGMYRGVTIYHIAVSLLLLLIFAKQIPHALKKNIYPTLKPAYSDTYLKKIKTFVLADDKPTIGAALKGGKDYRSAFSKQTAAYTLGYYLAYMEDGALALQISDFDIPNPTIRDKQARASNLFYRFVEQQRADGVFVSIGASQAAFLQAQDLSFVVLTENGLLRAEVRELVRDSIVDPLSGERFLLLK